MFHGQVAEGLRECTELKEFIADDNSLTGLPASLENWTKLTKLSLSNNSLAGTLPSLQPLVSLRTLDLSYNRIENFTGNGSLPKTVEYISVHSNGLDTIPETWYQLPAVEELHLGLNRFNSFTWPEWFETARGYRADNPHISTPSVAYELLNVLPPPDWPQLRKIDISFNPLEIDVTEFLQGFRALPCLTHLDCTGCQLYGKLTCDLLHHFDIQEVKEWVTNRCVGSVTSKNSFETLSSTGILTLASNNITVVDTSNEPLSKLARSIDLRYNYNDVDTSKCHDCPYGETSGVRADLCYCKDGHFRNSSGVCQLDCELGSELFNQTCRSCPAGQYGVMEKGKATCKECGADLNSTEGSIGENACYCLKGFIKHRNKLKCENCAEGIDCNEPIVNHSMVHTMNGYYLLRDTHNTETTTYAAGQTGMPVVISCPLKKACLGTDKDTGHTNCEVTYPHAGPSTLF
mmetsp:Transcript_52164/g.131038  ORF Transcript_52164/g.131038 Transcript_52164/m.131038 type:complete len:461 (-) Transcript_52164:92-1474(-)